MTYAGGLVKGRRETTVRTLCLLRSLTGPCSFSDVIHHDVIQLEEPGIGLKGTILIISHCELSKSLSVIRDQHQVFYRVIANELEEMGRTRYGGKCLCFHAFVTFQEPIGKFSEI